MSTRATPSRPLATYRLQLGPEMDFAGAGALVPYLARLGVTHLYLSPTFVAAPGSAHGYDVVDPTRLSEELGGEEGFTELCRIVREHGMGIVLDIVPNHMAIGRGNVWWWDLLENGAASRYARFFDVDWNPPEERLRDVILLPILGDHYGRVLEAGEIELSRSEAEFTVRYYDHELPVAPRSLQPLLMEAARRSGSDDLAFIADSYDRMAPATSADPDDVEQRYRDMAVLRRQLVRLFEEKPYVAGALDEVTAETNRDPERLGALLDDQHYRLAYWRTGGRELGYRRFFDIDTMAALRVEDEDVFAATHVLVLRLVGEACVDGLRIDHIDGLGRPADYLRRLRAAAPEAWVVVEKILEGDEKLRSSWPVAGTTGYGFLNDVGALLVDPAGEGPLGDLYAEFAGDATSWAEIAAASKRVVMSDLLGSDVARLTQLLLQICETRPRYRDYTRSHLHEAITALLEAFGVYRTYVSPHEGSIGDEDVRRIAEAVAGAEERHPDLDPELLEFVGAILRLDVRGKLESDFATRFQQVSGPVMAKGIEDTAFYRYHRLSSLCEVGGDPDRFGIGPERFHEARADDAERRPEHLITTSTHDTKRSEDVRARLAVLSEMPEAWRAAVLKWRDRHRRRSRGVDGPTEYLFYQTLVGAWPITADRMQVYLRKAVREAKLHTSWVDPDETYEKAVERFVRNAMSDAAFTASVEAFVASLEPAASTNALAQKLLCLTAPGVADVYQGTEIWNRRLVDPDNRVRVDFEGLAELLDLAADLPIGEITARSAEGLPKLRVVHRALQARARRPAVLGPGASYAPLLVAGRHHERVVAFLRGDAAAVVVPRSAARIGGDWADTAVDLPSGTWHDVLTDATLEGGSVPMSVLTRSFPVALLLLEEAG